ncbi:MAG: hypothetical protein FWD06_03395 [Oscillospiraceae bacterium]|nr:hypothetical protein [Oscillospiraceae bacterium]
MKKCLSILLVFALLFGVGAVSASAVQPAQLQCANAEPYNTTIDRPEDPDTFNWLRVILITVLAVVVVAVAGFGLWYFLAD